MTAGHISLLLQTKQEEGCSKNRLTVEITIVTRSTSLSQNLCVILHQVLAGAAAQFYGFVSFLTLSSALLGFTVTSQFSLNILPCGLRCKRHLNVWTHLVGLYLDERINMCL